MISVWRWWRRRCDAASARAYPTSAWVSRFDTVEDLRAALKRGDRP